MSENLGPDFNLPDEILSVIPTDPYDQLDLARKITSMAIASRVSNLENETGRLRQSLIEKDRVVLQLQQRVAELEDACQDAQVQLRIATEDNVCFCFISYSLVLLILVFVFSFVDCLCVG